MKIALDIGHNCYHDRGVKVQGIDGHHLYVLNNTTMTSLLIEGCFVD